ncbi:hypothetical protein ACFL56_02430 [Candidatus Margulisiibacteriota bacterium]
MVFRINRHRLHNTIETSHQNPPIPIEDRMINLQEKAQEENRRGYFNELNSNNYRSLNSIECLGTESKEHIFDVLFMQELSHPLKYDNLTEYRDRFSNLLFYYQNFEWIHSATDMFGFPLGLDTYKPEELNIPQGNTITEMKNDIKNQIKNIVVNDNYLFLCLILASITPGPEDIPNLAEQEIEYQEITELSEAMQLLNINIEECEPVLQHLSVWPIESFEDLERVVQIYNEQINNVTIPTANKNNYEVEITRFEIIINLEMAGIQIAPEKAQALAILLYYDNEYIPGLIEQTQEQNIIGYSQLQEFIEMINENQYHRINNYELMALVRYEPRTTLLKNILNEKINETMQNNNVQYLDELFNLYIYLLRINNYEVSESDREIIERCINFLYEHRALQRIQLSHELRSNETIQNFLSEWVTQKLHTFLEQDTLNHDQYRQVFSFILRNYLNTTSVELIIAIYEKFNNQLGMQYIYNDCNTLKLRTRNEEIHEIINNFTEQNQKNIPSQPKEIETLETEKSVTPTDTRVIYQNYGISIINETQYTTFENTEALENICALIDTLYNQNYSTQIITTIKLVEFRGSRFVESENVMWIDVENIIENTAIDDIVTHEIGHAVQNYYYHTQRQIFEFASTIFRDLKTYGETLPFEIIDDSNYITDRYILGEYPGHPSDGSIELFASTYSLYLRYPDQLAANILEVTDPILRARYTMLWVYMRDYIFEGQVFSEVDPFEEYTFTIY